VVVLVAVLLELDNAGLLVDLGLLAVVGLLCAEQRPAKVSDRLMNSNFVFIICAA
jgi:hypothetical protein